MAKKTNQPNITKQAAPVTAKKQEAPGTKKEYSFNLRLALLLGIITFLVYANTFSNSYALDDFTVIRDNRIVTKGISATGEILSTPYRRGWFITDNDLYRPLSLVMFAAEYQLFDGQPGVSHVMNVLVYAGCVMLLFLFLDEFFGKKKTTVAFIAALLFALHPIHTEVVANIKSRDELLCFFFAFLSLNTFNVYMNKGQMKHLILGSVFFLLSFLSKETVISFLFVIPFIYFFFKNENRQRSIQISVAGVAITVLFLIIRYSVLHAYGANANTSNVSFIDNFLVQAPSKASAFATELLILGKYLVLLVVPYKLVCDYSFNSVPFTSLGNVWVILSLLAYVAIAVFGIIRLVKNRKDPYGFAILFFLSTLALFTNIVFIIGAPMAERFVFFASVGFCLAVALLVDQFLGGNKTQEGTTALTDPKVLAFVVPVALIFAFISFSRNPDWKDNYTLFKADVKKSPDDCRISYYLGTEMIVTNAKSEGNPEVRKQIITEAMGYLKQSLKIYPDYTDANASLGDAYFKLGIYDSAEHFDQRALDINPKYTLAYNNIAGVYFMTNRYEKALEICQKAIALNPGYVNAYSNMGLCYMRIGKNDSALSVLYKAVAVDPTFTSAYENLVLVFKNLGKPDSVRKYSALAKGGEQ